MGLPGVGNLGADEIHKGEMPGLTAGEDRRGDVGGEEGQLQDVADIASMTALLRGEVGGGVGGPGFVVAAGASARCWDSGRRYGR